MPLRGIIRKLIEDKKRKPALEPHRAVIQRVSRVRLGWSEGLLPKAVRHCPVAMRYYHWLKAINWEVLPERNLEREYPYPPVAYSTFAAACLVKLDQGFTHMPQLRRYLVEHPALVWLLGFNLVGATRQEWGFDVEASVPTARHLTAMLRKVPNSYFQVLLDETVRLIRQGLPSSVEDFGRCIALDTKHILAWVKENNDKAYGTDRFVKDKQPAGDPDCRLGCKRRHNHGVDADNTPPTPTRESQPAKSVEVGEYYWGYGSGIVTTKVADWGEFVVAELTQPFNCADVSYFQPLMGETERRLGFRPTYGAFDAAFDAFYVHEYFYPASGCWQDGFAAVPVSQRQRHDKTYAETGEPLCEAGVAMRRKYTFISRSTLVEHERAHYICPLRDQPDATCPVSHKRWAKGGCTHRIPTSVGARIRHQIDHDSPLYKAIYKQRTTTERINAQAVAFGIERPHLRNQLSITNANTLIYVLINLRGLHRIQARQAQAA